jgi:flagellar motor switch protein FliN/FliY
MSVDSPISVATPSSEGKTALATTGAGTAALQIIPDTTLTDPRRDTRLDRLPMQLDVMVKVRSFRVEDLLSLKQGSLVETVHEHSQDVPVRSGGALLVWAEFEVVEQRLAVRVTRLA